jgi:hypothetical protein
MRRNLRITTASCEAWPLTPTLSSLLKAEHIRVLSPRTPKGRWGEGTACHVDG